MFWVISTFGQRAAIPCIPFGTRPDRSARQVVFEMAFVVGVSPEEGSEGRRFNDSRLFERTMSSGDAAVIMFTMPGESLGQY